MDPEELEGLPVPQLVFLAIKSAVEEALEDLDLEGAVKDAVREATLEEIESGKKRILHPPGAN